MRDNVLLIVVFCNLYLAMVVYASHDPYYGPFHCPTCSEWRQGNPCHDYCCKKDHVCLDKKMWGCYCIEGTKRNEQGVCIDKERCPPDPKPICCYGKKYDDDGDHCKDVCGMKAKDCPDCHEKGCFCRHGKKDVAGVCRNEKYCPKCSNGRYFWYSNNCAEKCELGICRDDDNRYDCFCYKDKPYYYQKGSDHSKCHKDCHWRPIISGR